VVKKANYQIFVNILKWDDSTVFSAFEARFEPRGGQFFRDSEADRRSGQATPSPQHAKEQIVQ